MFIETVELPVRTPATHPALPLKHSQPPASAKATAGEARPPLPLPPSPTHQVSPSPPLPLTSPILPEYLSSRMVKFFLLPAVLFTAIYTREYTGEYQTIINNHVGGIFYVLFGSLFFSYFLKRMRNWQAVSVAFTIVSLLEMLQWFNFPFVMALTENPVLSFLFGNSFNPVDFIYYGMGALAGLLVLWVLQENQTVTQ